MREGEIAVGVDLDHALVPAVALLDRLVDRQRVEEFVGDHDGRAVRHLVERLVPERPATSTLGQRRSAAALLQHRADLDQMQHDRRRGTPAPPWRRAARRASWCRGRGRARPAARCSGEPICCQTAAAHSPISSPNIWLISGAVMKSPPRAERIARRCSSRARGWVRHSAMYSPTGIGPAASMRRRISASSGVMRRAMLRRCSGGTLQRGRR